ncbi:heme biosynthesis protein HemY [Cognatishimia activa]|uniref:heme biosynthesis protein HemY n=1 Tax=Cognatishimia activa TaxID=1715691 RepID=UPI00223280CE|nr:heme biosynthesis HemY N-terminal domain-containing protein [Cognatishimia activa]UZD90754.1 heme biosynthesis protein HemY [Cognatishimia activa]
MLWSLTKIVVFVAAIAGLTLGAGYLMESDGGVMITIAGVEYTLTPLMSAIALSVLVVVLWVLLKLASLTVAVLKFLNGDETAISRYFDRNRERRGYKALTEGMMALASGEGRVAMDKARKAERLLRKPELTNLITAQAAEVSGDRRKAEEVYKRLLADDTTRFVGVRGLMKQKLDAGKTDVALKLAETAFALKPRHVETQDTLLKLQAGEKDWSGARQTLKAKLKHGGLPRDVHRRRDAVLALSEAKDLIGKDASIEMREAAIEANRLSPDLIPAAVMASKSYVTEGKPKYATRVLKKAWEAQPHPDLAAAFASIVPAESPTERIKRFGALVKTTADHAESKMLMAELNIAAEDFPAARRALGDLIEKDPTARNLTIMAAIERGEGAEDAAVKGWLANALTAPRGPQWVCDSCQNIHSEWAPVCDNCQSFDTLTWKTPPASEAVSPTGVEMLPLIVGELEKSEEGDAPVDVTPAEPVAEVAK